MNSNVEDIVILIDKAVSIANSEYEKIKNEAKKSESAKTVLKNLVTLRANFLNGKIGPAHGSQLGLSKNLPDWTSNQELIDLGNKIDDFYEENF